MVSRSPCTTVGAPIRALANRQAAQGYDIGESGIAGLAGLLLAAADPMAREKLRLTRDSRVLLFGTEGITDRVEYDRIICSRQS